MFAEILGSDTWISAARSICLISSSIESGELAIPTTSSAETTNSSKSFESGEFAIWRPHHRRRILPRGLLSWWVSDSEHFFGGDLHLLRVIGDKWFYAVNRIVGGDHRLLNVAILAYDLFKSLGHVFAIVWSRCFLQNLRRYCFKAFSHQLVKKNILDFNLLHGKNSLLKIALSPTKAPRYHHVGFAFLPLIKRWSPFAFSWSSSLPSWSKF